MVVVWGCPGPAPSCGFRAVPHSSASDSVPGGDRPISLIVHRFKISQHEIVH